MFNIRTIFNRLAIYLMVVHEAAHQIWLLARKIHFCLSNVTVSFWSKMQIGSQNLQLALISGCEVLTSNQSGALENILKYNFQLNFIYHVKSYCQFKNKISFQTRIMVDDAKFISYDSYLGNRHKTEREKHHVYHFVTELNLN